MTDASPDWAELRRRAEAVRDGSYVAQWDYRAAANPATILALLDERAALLAEAARLREALDAIAGFAKIDMRGCWEHELRDIIGSMTDGAERALTGGDPA